MGKMKKRSPVCFLLCLLLVFTGQVAAIPIVAMTANAFEEDREKSYRAGMNGHLAKPVSVENLMNMIYKVMA